MFDAEDLNKVLWWVDKGFSILPCQPGSKSLIAGFGQYKRKLKTSAEVRKWFRFGSSFNVAVVAPFDALILDFDQISVYALWADKCPAAAQSYTQATPRGGRHVFIRGEAPAGLHLVEGAEVKRVALVEPSQIGGVQYKTTMERPFYDGDISQVLSPLSKPGCATPYALIASRTRARATNATGMIPTIKQHYPISKVLETYLPKTNFIGRGGWLTCLCPFHDDHKPSFYFSDAVGVWGCHACNVRGDVINLYARFEQIPVREAISRLWAVMS
jgi:hypothetical protein